MRIVVIASSTRAYIRVHRGIPRRAGYGVGFRELSRDAPLIKTKTAR